MEHKDQKTVWNSEHVLSTMRNFYAADKPPAITTHDIDLVILLMAYKALDHAVNHSIETLARYLKKDVKTVRSSIEHLIAMGWLHRERRKGASSGLMLIADKLPQAETSADAHKVTADAKALAKVYHQAVVLLALKDRKMSKRKKKAQSTTRWGEAQQYNAQNILNRCDGDVALAKQMLQYALGHPRLARIARESLYKLFKWWKHVEQSYSEHLQAAHAKEVTQ